MYVPGIGNLLTSSGIMYWLHWSLHGSRWQKKLEKDYIIFCHSQYEWDKVYLVWQYTLQAFHWRAAQQVTATRDWKTMEHILLYLIRYYLVLLSIRRISRTLLHVVITALSSSHFLRDDQLDTHPKSCKHCNLDYKRCWLFLLYNITHVLYYVYIIYYNISYLYFVVVLVLLLLLPALNSGQTADTSVLVSHSAFFGSMRSPVPP